MNNRESGGTPIGDMDQFFDIALDMLCISSADGYFKRLNSAFSRTLGWSIEEMLTTPYIELVHPDDVEATLLEVERQMARGEKVLHFENRYRHKDGSYRVLAWKSVPQPGGYMYAVARDVTESLEQQKALEEKNADLEQFSRAVAHDLRAPLRAIASYAELLELDYGSQLPDEARTDLGRIRANAAKMATMFDGLLRFSRAGIQELDKASTDVTAMARDVVADLQESIKDRSVEFVVEDMPPAYADSPLLKIVLSNLLSNAVKYTRFRENALIEVGFDAGADPPAYYVRDNGAGFDARHAGKLFAVFSRMHPISAYEGHGIGLATVQRIIHRHGGRVWASGEVDKGATFYFTV